MPIHAVDWILPHHSGIHIGVICAVIITTPILPYMSLPYIIDV